MNKNLKKNIYWNTVGVTLNSFTSLFFLVIINRINGINDGGIFSFSFSLACLFFVIGAYATRTYQISDVDKKFNDSEYLVHKVMTCCLMIFVSLIYALFIEDIPKKYLIVILTLFRSVEAFSDTLYGYMQKKDKLYLAGISLTIKAILSVGIFLIVDIITKNIIISSISMIFVSMIITIFFDGYYSKKFILREEIRIKNLFSLFFCGFPIFIISFLSIYIVNASKYTMNGILNDASQTIFGIILMPATIINLCGQYIMNPMMNELVNSFNSFDYDGFKNKVNTIIKLLFVLWAFAEIAAYLLGIPVLNLLYAIDITKYKYDLLLIIFGAIFYASAIIFQNCLIIMHKNKLQIIIYAVSSVFSFIMSYILIVSYGIHGAVYTYFFTMLLHSFMYFIYFNYEIYKIKKQKK